MHQQPRATEHPLALNSVSMSGQRSGVRGRTVSFMGWFEACLVQASSNGALRFVFFVLRLDRRAGLFPVGVGPGEELVELAAVDEAGAAVDGDGLAREGLAAVGHG